MRTHALTLAATLASLAITQTCRADVPANGWNLHWQQCLQSYTTNQGFAAFNALTAPENAATGTIERFDDNLSSWKRQVTIWRQPCPADDRFPAVFVRIHTLEDGPGTGFLTIYAVDLKLVQPAYLQFPTQPASMAMCSNIVDCGRAIVSQTSVTTAGNTFTFLLAHGFDQAFRLDQSFQIGWESAVGTVTIQSAVDEFTVFANDFEFGVSPSPQSRRRRDAVSGLVRREALRESSSRFNAVASRRDGTVVVNRPFQTRHETRVHSAR